MTAFEEWCSGTAKALVRDIMVESLEAVVQNREEDFHRLFAELEQRVAIGLVQARALEDRHLAGELLINGGNNAIAKQVAANHWDRSHKLEAIGLMLAKQYPPANREVMVCRCEMAHGEVQAGEGFVCAHCKLPKTAKAEQASGPRLVV